MASISPWSPVSGGITSPKGFKASGISAGLKASGKDDLALLLLPEGTICSGMFTSSSVRAACIDLCKERLKESSCKIRAVLINSGQANACTGEFGLANSLLATKSVASQLGLREEEVLICSTGIIGVPINMPKLLSAIPRLVENLSFEGGSDAAKAILTTDLTDKQFAIEANFQGRNVRIGGMAKGSGMIHPNMATMLAYLTCDAGVSPEIWDGMINRVVEKSFNAISVDGDTSTNDTFLAFASGEPLANQFLIDLEEGLRLVSEYLAKSIVRDGEGATCLIETKVEGAENDEDARTIARTICSSSLVKTAIHGCDPNWGRIVAAVGRAGVHINHNSINIWIGSYQLLLNGEPLPFNRNLVSLYIKNRISGEYLTDDSVCILVQVGSGPGFAYGWGCDLSDQYVRINADYTT